MKCDKCKSKVKAKDKFCASCGEEIKKAKKRLPIGGIITLAILFLLLAAIVASNSNNSNLTPEQVTARAEARAAQQAERDKAKAEKNAAEEEKRCSDQTMAYVMSQKFVKARLKSPSTAKFPNSTNAGVRTQYLGDCTHRIQAFVDSQNSFGATLRTTYLAELKKNSGSNNWSLINLQIQE